MGRTARPGVGWSEFVDITRVVGRLKRKGARDGKEDGSFTVVLILGGTAAVLQ